MGGVTRENLHQGFSLRNIVSVLHEGCRSGSTKPLSYRSTEWVCGKWGSRLARESFITPHGASSQCSTRSAGQVRPSLLSVGPLLYKCSIRLLTWFWVLSLYVVATRWISSVMLGIWRSMWSSRLLTYRGAFTIVLRSFDWNRWINFNLVGLAHPHNWTPYDQMGLRTTLCRSNLLFRDNMELRPRSQSICLNYEHICRTMHTLSWTFKESYISHFGIHVHAVNIYNSFFTHICTYIHIYPTLIRPQLRPLPA